MSVASKEKLVVDSKTKRRNEHILEPAKRLKWRSKCNFAKKVIKGSDKWGKIYVYESSYKKLDSKEGERYIN